MVVSERLGLNSYFQEDSCLWRGLKVVYEYTIYSVPFVIGGIALKILLPALAPPFFAMAVAMPVTRVVVKLGKRYNWTLIEKVTDKTIKFVEKYPHVQLITFIFSLLVCGVSPLVGAVVATGCGVMSGILFDSDRAQRQLQLNQQLIRSEPSQVDHILMV